MNVNLTPELERVVQEKVRSGLYRSQSEVVRHALRVMMEHEEQRGAELSRLRGALAEGIAEAERGDLLDGDAVLAEARARLDATRATDS